MPRWNIYAVDMLGNILYEVVDGTPSQTSDELDSYKSGFKFKMPDISYNHNYTGALTEFQLWRNGKFFDWGVSTMPKSTPNQDGVLEVQCNNLLWYFYRRVFGSAFPRNLLNNGDFEQGGVGLLTPAGWTAHLADVAVQNTNFFTGRQAVRLHNDTEQADAFLQQVIAWDTSGRPDGDYGVFTVWFFLEEFDAPAYQQRGVYCDVVVGGVSQGPGFYPFTNSQPVGVWTRIQSAGLTPGNTPDTGWDNRLYVPKGTIVYDDCAFNLEDSISTGPMGEDQALLMRDIIAYAQDPTWGKSNLHITFDNSTIPLTGINRNLSYNFVDNKRIFDAFMDFTKYVDGFDFGLEFPDANGSETPGSVRRRVFHIYPIKPGISMGKGRTWDPAVLKLKVNVTVQDIEPAQDGEQITTAMIVQSGNSGTGREQGGAVDASKYGGLILETVEQAPDTTSINGLTGMAQKRLKQLNSGANIPVVKTKEKIDIPAMPIIGKLKAGDIVTVELDYTDPNGRPGWAVWEDQYRVVKTEMQDPYQDEFDLTLNIVSL